jgi:hypothetical protein
MENVAEERDKLVRLYTTGGLDDAQYDPHAAELKNRQELAQREVERLQTSNERIKRLKGIESNPLLPFLFAGAGEITEDMRCAYYGVLGLRLVADRDGVPMNGSQIVALPSMSGTKK